MKNASKSSDKYLKLLFQRYPRLSETCSDIKKAYSLLKTCYQNNGKLLIGGNGGSAADAEHIVGELMKSFKNPRTCPSSFADKLKIISPESGMYIARRLQGALPAIALDGHPALSTAFLNDVDGELNFAQQVYGYGKPGDILMALSTSGNSKNLIYAATVAKALEMHVISLTGSQENLLTTLSDVIIKVPVSETYMVQELHLPIYHCLCLMLETDFFPE